MAAAPKFESGRKMGTTYTGWSPNK